MENRIIESVRQHAIEGLKELKGHGPEASEIHHRLFNEDLFLIGTYQAKQWLGESSWEAIESIKEYEQDNFGEVTTDLSNPESVANMLAYVIGEDVLTDSPTLMELWDKRLDDKELSMIIDELSE
jgi:hypothetical protein